MHTHAYDAVAQFLQTIDRPARVVEIGSRNINGSVRPLFPGARYTGVDLAPGAGVDVIGDGVSFTTVPAPDVVVCCEVLEHVPDPGALVANLLRLVAPGGHVLITCAMPGRVPHSAVDGGPLRDGEVYQNIEPASVEAWLASAVECQVIARPDRGDLYAIARRARADVCTEEAAG